ncbi:Aste57867_23059 [Aphanomyces stellatus]|uniref:Aste57867_23059 protein n=1 Tax=Aphanomyces stellatus TaxID=120398 RepID=A0A485LMS4_9STRA|nr:hypothetical protein As57867_022988 [Aphanomyces stellatus]VFT99707.1 Aste57867_23059 [Aphanomyces stellatus]
MTSTTTQVEELSQVDEDDLSSLVEDVLSMQLSELIQSKRRKFTMSDIVDPPPESSTSSSADSLDEGAAHEAREAYGGQRRKAFRSLWNTHAHLGGLACADRLDADVARFIADIEAVQGLYTQDETSAADWPVGALEVIVGQLYHAMDHGGALLALVRVLAKALRWKRNQAAVLRSHPDFLLRIGAALQATVELVSNAVDVDLLDTLAHWLAMTEVCLVGPSAVATWGAWADTTMTFQEDDLVDERVDCQGTPGAVADAWCLDAMDEVNHVWLDYLISPDSSLRGDTIGFVHMPYHAMPPFVSMGPHVVDCLVRVLRHTRDGDAASFLPLQLRLLTLLGSILCVRRSIARGLDLDDATLSTLFDLLVLDSKQRTLTHMTRLVNETHFARLVVFVALEACESSATTAKWHLVAEKLSLLTSTFRWIQDQALKLAMHHATTSMALPPAAPPRPTHWLLTTTPLAWALNDVAAPGNDTSPTWCDVCRAQAASMWLVAGLFVDCPSTHGHHDHRLARIYHGANLCFKALFDVLFVAFVCPTAQYKDDDAADVTSVFLQQIVMVALDILKASRTPHGMSVEMHAAAFLRHLYELNQASTVVLTTVLRKYQAWTFLLHHPALFAAMAQTHLDVGSIAARHATQDLALGDESHDVAVTALPLARVPSSSTAVIVRTHVYTHAMLASLFVSTSRSAQEKKDDLFDQLLEDLVHDHHDVLFVYSIVTALARLLEMDQTLQSHVFAPSCFSRLVYLVSDHAKLHKTALASATSSPSATLWVTRLATLRLLHQYVTNPTNATVARTILHREFTSQRSTAATVPQYLLPCLFGLLRERPCVPFALDMLSVLLDAAISLMFDASDASGDRFDFLHTNLFQTFTQTISELISYADGIETEVTAASMVAVMTRLLTDHNSRKELQVLFRDCGAFVHLTNLVHSRRYMTSPAYIQITRDVCHVLTLLMAKNRESKAEFRMLMASTYEDHERVAYEPLVHVFLAAEQGRPSWASMQVVWLMMLDNDVSVCRVRNPDAIPVLFCLFPHCAPNVQVDVLCQFKQLFVPSPFEVLNRSMCCYVQPSTMDQLVNALELGIHVPEVVDLMVEIGWHSIGVRQLKHIFRLLQQPAMASLVAPLVDALYYMVQGQIGHQAIQPSRFFFFDGDTSGLELAPFPFPTKGYTFHTWLRLEDDACHNPTTLCLFSFLDKFMSGYRCVVRDGHVEYHFHGHVLQTTVRLEPNRWYCLTVVHSSGTFRLRPEAALFLNGELAWVDEVAPVDFDGPVTYGNVGCSMLVDATGHYSVGMCGQMLMGAIYFFKKPLLGEQMAQMYRMGPDAVLFRRELEWSVDMAWSYNPSVWEGQYFLDSSSNFQETVPLQAAARRMDGTNHIFTRSAMDVLDCIGGIAVLFPLFAQFDAQDSLDLNANVLKLFCAVLKNNATNQRFMQENHGFLVTGYLLSRVSPNHMTLQALNTIHSLVVDESLPFQAQALKYWLADFSLWVFTPRDIQVHVVKILQRLVQDHAGVCDAIVTVRKVLDDLRLYYWFTPPSDIWDNEDSHTETPLSPSHFEKRESKFNRREWIHPETKAAVASHLEEADRKVVRVQLLALLDLVCRRKDELDAADISALSGFLAFSGDEVQKMDVLSLLLKLLPSSSLSFRQSTIASFGKEARRHVNTPELTLAYSLHPSSGFGGPIDGVDMLFALVLRRPQLSAGVKLQAFQLLLLFFTHGAHWAQSEAPETYVYLLCAMEYIESYDLVVPVCFQLLVGSYSLQDEGPTTTMQLHNPSVIPALFSSLLLCDPVVCLEHVQALDRLVVASARNTMLLTPHPRLFVLLLLRFSANEEHVQTCLTFVTHMILHRLRTVEDGWWLLHAILASIDAVVVARDLSYHLRSRVTAQVLSSLTVDHVKSPRQPTKGSKWQYLSQDSERQKMYILYSNVWHLAFLVEFDLFSEDPPDTCVWQVATALIELLQSTSTMSCRSHQWLEMEMLYWLNFPLDTTNPSEFPWLARKGGMVRVVLHVLMASMDMAKSEAFVYLRDYVLHDTFPHARNDPMIVRLIGDVVDVFRRRREDAAASSSRRDDTKTLFQLIQELVRRHKGMLQLTLLDSNESVLHGKAVDVDDVLLATLQKETQLNIQWSIWESVMTQDTDAALWAHEMKMQRVSVVARDTWTLVQWELLSTLCKRDRYNTPTMDAILSNAMRMERSVWKLSSETHEKQRLTASHTWQRILRSLTNERGPWGQQCTDETPNVIFWKLDSSENHMRQRLKLKRYYNAKEIALPTTAEEPALLLSQEAQISLATELLQAKALASYNEDFYRKYKLDLHDDDVDDCHLDEGIPPRHKESLPGDVSFECEWVAKTKVMAGALQIAPPHLVLSLAEKKKPRKYLLQDLEQIYFRQYQFQPCAMEFFFRGGVTLLVNLFDRKTCQAVDQSIRMLQPLRLRAMGGRNPRQLFERSELTDLWVQRKLSNFDYLMHLNSIAGRTYNDLAQYPIFPWILTDYESETLDLNNPATFRNLERPIGVQSDQQLAFFTERYKVLDMEYQRSVKGPADMDDMPQLPPFHYGTHYSSSAFVIGFLIRLQPFTNYHLRLQGGKMDHADRLFHSIDAAYKSCTSNPSDVRELIPEFFYLPDFLTNSSTEPLGTKQNGDVVHHVHLPPWAKNSPEEFIRLHRLALESEYVSLNLHHWIDLIFGFKQRPPLFGGTSHAVSACNVYFHLTYDGAVDLDKLKRTDPHLYETTLRQIDCFGQTPPQLLFRPHPKRYLNQDLIMPIFQSLSLVGYPRSRLSRFRRPLLFLAIEGDVCVGIDTNRNVSVHKWRELPPDHEPPFHLTPQPSMVYSIGVPFATHAVTTYADTAMLLSSALFATFRKHVFSCGHWDHSIRITSLESGLTLQTLLHHHDVVTCLALSEDGAYLVSGSSDNTVVVWTTGKVDNMVPCHTLYGHDDGITGVAVSTSFDLVISSSRDGTLIVHTLSNGRYLRTIRPVKQATTGGPPPRLRWVGLSAIGQIVTYCESNSTLFVYSINGKCLATTRVDQKLQTFQLTKDGQSLIAGGRGQTVVVYRLYDMHIVLEFDGSDRATRGFQSPIHALCLSRDEMHLMVGLGNGDVCIYTPNAEYLRERLQKRLTNLGF